MAQMQETERPAPDASLALEAKHHRLQTLVGELLATNQELRFRIARLEHEAQSAERALERATAGTALLMP